MTDFTVATKAAEDVFSTVMTDEFTLGDKVLKSLQMMGMGMGTVFAVLFIIWFALTLFKVFMNDIPAKRKAKRAQNEKVSAAAEEIPTEALPESESDDGVTVAVITAALQAYMDAENNSVPFRVVSFKRKGTASPWNNN